MHRKINRPPLASPVPRGTTPVPQQIQQQPQNFYPPEDYFQIVAPKAVPAAPPVRVEEVPQQQQQDSIDDMPSLSIWDNRKSDHVDQESQYTASSPTIPSSAFKQPNFQTPSKQAVSPRVQHAKSPQRIDPFYESSSASTSDVDVTVFGFPQSKVSYILKQFSQYGEIVDYKVGNGNWMHIKYKEKFSAQRALSKNGKIYDGLYMIGVVECIEPAVFKKTTSYNQRATLKRQREDIYEDVPQEKRAKPEPEKSLWSKILDKILAL